MDFFIEMDVGVQHQHESEHHEVTITENDLIDLAISKLQKTEKYYTFTSGKNVKIYTKQRLI